MDFIDLSNFIVRDLGVAKADTTLATRPTIQRKNLPLKENQPSFSTPNKKSHCRARKKRSAYQSKPGCEGEEKRE